MYNYAYYGYCVAVVYMVLQYHDHKFTHVVYSQILKGWHNSVPLDTVAMRLSSSEAVEVPRNNNSRLPASLWQYYTSIASTMQIIFILSLQWHYIPCPRLVGSTVADSWKNNISFVCLLAWLLCCNAMMLHVLLLLFLPNCELVHLHFLPFLPFTSLCSH